MQFKGSYLSVLVATSVIALLVSSEVMCQKSQGVKPESSQPPGANKTQSNSTKEVGMTMTADTSFNKTGSATEYYTCTMHHQVHEANPGKCPICGMDLVFHKKDKTPK